MVTCQLRITGRVQGVGYRASLQCAARKAGVTGWVRNRSDGSVEALLQGSADAVEAVVAWARRGPPGSRVAAVEQTPAAAPQQVYASFELRPTG